jgi:UDP-galactopyranose mutase
MDPSELDASVAVRIPTRSNKDNRYFYRYLPGDAFERLHKDV